MAESLTSEDFEPTLSLDEHRVNVDPATRRIAVRIARWEDVHSGFGQVVRMPRNVNVEAAHVGEARLDSGATLRVATLPMETMHAPKNLSALHAASWYENTGKGVARVRYSTDEVGLRADGVLFDDIDDDQLVRLKAASPSGDWRGAVAIKSPLDIEHTPADLVGACIVNIPGFSETFTDKPAQKFAFAASANSIMVWEGDVPEMELTASADGEKPECDGDEPCDGCTCGKSGPEDKKAYSQLAQLRASAQAQIEEIDALLAAGSYEDDRMVAAGMYEEQMRIFDQRLQDLEQLVADAILNI